MNPRGGRTVSPEYKYIVPLTGAASQGREELGGKAFNLQRLMEANFHVPGGFVVTARAFREVVAGLVADGGGWDGIDRMSELVCNARLPQRMVAEILSAAATLRTITGPALVVRSSATTEDLENSSMAGQAASFANVVTDDTLLQAIRGCWASLFTRETITYHSSQSPAGGFPEMAVVVQQLIPACRAGVLFTLNPVTGDTSQFLASASWGLGETVVAGRAADTVVLDRRSGAVVDEELADKKERLVPARGGGTARQPVPPELARAPVIDETFARTLVEVATRVEAVFGAPQDLEWAEWEGRVYLLQTRPVTAVGRKERRTVWSNANVGEALPGVGTPFTWSIIHSFSRKGFLHAFRGLGCCVPDGYEIVGSVRGRVYLNLSEFMSVTSQIPFISPKMLLQVAGGGGVDELEGTYRKLPRVGFLVRSPTTLSRLLWSRMVSPTRIALWSQKFKRFESEFPFDTLSQMSMEELAALYRRTDEVFEQTGTLMLEVSSHFLMNYLSTSVALNRLLGERAARLERALFSGLAGIRSAEPGLDLLRMARSVARSPALVEQVLRARPERLLEELAGGGREERSLLLAIEAFLESHGHRAAREAEISEPRWREDPSFPLSVLQKYLQDPHLPDPERMIGDRILRREEVTNRVVRSLPRPFRRFFSRLLRTSQEAARTREEMRNSVVHTIGFYRNLSLEVGRRLVAEGTLQTPEDAFFLTRPEQLAFVEEHTTGLGVVAAMRKLEHEALESLPDLPGTFVMEGDRLLLSQHEVSSGMRLTGLPGSSGVITGRVAVVKHPGEQDKVRHGDVLVAPFTDVGWTPLFLVVSAVVTELGGPLSHSCVVAREYGVPAVVNVKNATTILKDGDIVTVDGDQGVLIVKR